MGDEIGLGVVTDCLLRSFSDLKRQTELHYVGWVKNNNKRNPNRCHLPLITQLNVIQTKSFSSINYDFLEDEITCLSFIRYFFGVKMAIDV